MLARTAIGAGFGVIIDERGAVQRTSSDEVAPLTDDDGFIVRADGSIVDLAHRSGVPIAVAAETTRATELDRACTVNRLWMLGLVELAAARRDRPRAQDPPAR